MRNIAISAIALIVIDGCNGDDSTTRGVAVPGASIDARVGIDASGVRLDASTTLEEPPSLADAALDPPVCGDQRCQCADGIDNDDDGRIDLDDRDCSSLYENDEQPYSNSWGDHRYDTCQGCFFSAQPGSAEDGCPVPLSCVTSGTTSGGGSCSRCAASRECQDFCLPLVPKGCDCFGCCTISSATGGARSVLVDTDCDPRGDLRACKSCVPSTTCANACDRCELCIGMTAADLPAACAVDGGSVADGG